MTAQAFSVTIRCAASRTTCLCAMTEEAFETCRLLWGSGPLLVHRVIQKKEIEYSFSAMIETRSFANKKG